MSSRFEGRLVRIEWNKNNPCKWDIFSLSGNLYGHRLAVVDCVSLRNPRFHRKSITGVLSAVYGAEVNDAIYGTHRIVVGAGGSFRLCYRQALWDAQCNAGWFDRETFEAVENAYCVNAIGSHVWYSHFEDLRSDLAPIPASVEFMSKKLIDDADDADDGQDEDEDEYIRVFSEKMLED